MLAVVMAGAVISPVTCRADARCPWLNAATAGGVLGGEVQVAVTPLTLQGDATCEFSRRLNSIVYVLRIAVHTMDVPSKDFAAYLAQCEGSTALLRAIGNEAVQCVMKDGPAKGKEQVIGRVRERVFILTVYREGIARTNESGLRDDTRNLAEQIAGSLF